MEKEYFHPIRLSTAAFMCTALLCFVNSSAEDLSNLDRRLRTVRYTKGIDRARPATLESECLFLIADHTTSVDKGKIYATIAFIYTDRGYGPEDDPNVATKAFHYSMKALDYPLNPLTACYMYSRGSSAVAAQAWRGPKRPFAEVRETAAELCLKGLKLALDSDAPKEYPKPADGADSAVIASGTTMERLIRQRNQQVEAREKWLCDLEWYWLRQDLFNRCVSLYHRPPDERDAFEKKARQILKGHDDVVGELIAALDASVAMREND